MASKIPEGLRFFQSAKATTLNTGSTATLTGTRVDCADLDWVCFIIQLGTIASNGGLSVVKFGHSTASSGGTFTDFTSGSLLTDGATKPGLADGVTIGDTSDDKIYHVIINTQGKRRYIGPILTTAAAADTVVNSIVAFGGSGNAPNVDPNTSGVLYIA